MKRTLSLILAMVLMVSMLAGCGSKTETPSTPDDTSKAEETTYNFSVANIYAAINNHGILGQAWCDEITARTDGRVTFDFYPGASLVADGASYDAIKTGIADIAMFSTASTPGVFPAMSLLEVPQGYGSGWVGTKVANEFLAEFDLAEFNGIHPLYVHTTSPLVILGNKEVKTAADFKGMIIRSGSDLATKTATALKGQAYSCQITELYEALSKNMCDAAISGIDTLAGFNLAEVVKYVYPDPSYGKIGVILTAMNENKWNSLPADIQAVFEEVSAEFADNQGMCWRYEDAVSLDTFQKDHNGSVVYFDEATQAELKAMLDPVTAEFAANTGIAQSDIEAYQAFLTERIEKYNAEQPSFEEAIAWGDSFLAVLK